MNEEHLFAYVEVGKHGFVFWDIAGKGGRSDVIQQTGFGEDKSAVAVRSDVLCFAVGAANEI